MNKSVFSTLNAAVLNPSPAARTRNAPAVRAGRLVKLRAMKRKSRHIKDRRRGRRSEDQPHDYGLVMAAGAFVLPNSFNAALTLVASLSAGPVPQ